MLGWANQFSVCAFLNNHSYNDKHRSYDCLLAAGCENYFSASKNILSELPSFLQQHNDWLFGHLGYDLKNEIENLRSSHADKICFPDIFLFQPTVVITIKENNICIESLAAEPQKIWEEITSFPIEKKRAVQQELKIEARINKSEYLQIIQQLKEHILRGDCYEINFCQEFFSENTVIHPLQVYYALSKLSPAPFSCYYKLRDKYLLCASPERFLKKTGSTILSQPMKGTAPRNLYDADEDKKLKEELHASSKDRSENVMIADLVRNDLSKVCKEGSVHAEELFGVYSFPQVHQMVSTICGELREDMTLADILHATFPMGSMTGAPKRRVMQLIEQYEKTKRGIFSGSVGYITPDKNFDFNVVIRSIMYNALNKYVSYYAGSGITFYSDAEKEYEECLLKAAAMESALKQSR